MKPWKVILAAVLIFTAGIVTGAVGGHLLFPQKPAGQLPPLGLIQRPEFVRTMGQKLNLTPDQWQRVEAIMRDSQERMKPLRALLDPLMQEELVKVKEEILHELNPKQQEQFEELLKRRLKKPEAAPQREPRRPGNDSHEHPMRPGPAKTNAASSDH